MNWKYATSAAFVIPTLILVILVSIKECDIWSVMIYATALYCGFPMMIAGFYMTFTGKGYRWMNIGVDWYSVGETTARKYAAYFGKYLVVSSALLTISISLIMVDLYLMLATMAVSLCIMFLPVVKIHSKKDPSYYQDVPSVSSSKAWILTILVSAMVAVPVGYFLLEGSNTENVTVDVYEDRFTVKAPMFDKTFYYDKIDSFVLNEDFDKGKRISGYGTFEIKSGHFRNSELGDYQLASYAKVVPCIVLFVNGDAYAFNQESADDTVKIFEVLILKISLL